MARRLIWLPVFEMSLLIIDRGAGQTGKEKYIKLHDPRYHSQEDSNTKTSNHSISSFSIKTITFTKPLVLSR
jgi:hypothetical protein